MTRLHPQESISHGGWHALCHRVYSLPLVPDVGFHALHIQYTLPARRTWLFRNPPQCLANAPDQWQQYDPVGNKGYEVWQWCAHWSPSSCLFLQATGSQTEEWKSDPYIDFGGGKFVGPSGVLMNRKSASGFLQVDVQKGKKKKSLITAGWCGGLHIKGKRKLSNFEKHN